MIADQKLLYFRFHKQPISGNGIYGVPEGAEQLAIWLDVGFMTTDRSLSIRKIMNNECDSWQVIIISNVSTTSRTSSV